MVAWMELETIERLVYTCTVKIPSLSTKYGMRPQKLAPHEKKGPQKQLLIFKRKFNPRNLIRVRYVCMHTCTYLCVHMYSRLQKFTFCTKW